MYLPQAFREDRPEVLHAAMRAASLPILVGTGPDGGLIASHVPMLLDETDGPHGTLIGHLAKVNPHTKGTGEALAIFTGPDSYITPSWYPNKPADGKVVPTWNYVAVHASGPIEFFNDPDRLMEIVTRLTNLHEAGRAQPWAVSDAPADYIQMMLRGITGFRLQIAKLEGKWKMSQNRDQPTRAAVAAGLQADGKPEIAAFIPAV